MSFLTANSFVFNGKSSEDFNVIISWINSDIDVSTNGLNREIVKNTTGNTNLKDTIYGSENADRITFSFCIVKPDGSELTRPESIMINQWLTSSPLPQLLKFNDKDSYMLHYYAVCTQIKDVIVGGCFVGKELKFETNSAFAFMDKTEKSYDITTDEQTLYLNNPSDANNGIYYPSITISTASEEIIIENATDRKSVTLNTVNIPADAEGNKVLKLDCSKMAVLDANEKLIPASLLGWDENYQSHVSSTGESITNIYWVRLLKGINELKIIGTCSLKIECEFPRKAGCL